LGKVLFYFSAFLLGCAFASYSQVLQKSKDTNVIGSAMRVAN